LVRGCCTEQVIVGRMRPRRWGQHHQKDHPNITALLPLCYDFVDLGLYNLGWKTSGRGNCRGHHAIASAAWLPEEEVWTSVEMVVSRPSRPSAPALSHHQRRCHRQGGDRMERDNRRTPPFSPDHAFVVQFYAETQVEAGQLVGRVEHVVSGQATHFQSLETLLAFLARVLREVQAESPTRTDTAERRDQP
jgi:hypothetical protein